MKQKLFILILVCIANPVFAATQMASDRISDIRNTKHNFAASDVVSLPGGGERDVKATSENQVCIFCHTPHGKPNISSGDRPFLWNRAASNSGFTMYDSSSLNATNLVLGQGSKMCMSCHDGTVAIGQLDVLNGRVDGQVDMTGNNVSAGLLVGGKTNLGQDLTNDHPIGFTYNSQLATDDGELIDPVSAEGAHIGVPVGRGLAHNNSVVESSSGTAAGANQPTTTTTDDLKSGAVTQGISVPLESTITGLGDTNDPENFVRTFVDAAGTGTIECTSCHDAHIRSTDNTVNIKFLRLRRFQKTTGPVAVDGFKIDNDINCLACHKKSGWENSVHASASTATQVYDDTVADEREFPRDIEMWEASCLNCHAPHTVSSARWLLRQKEVTTAGSEASDVDRSCYECHSNNSPAVSSGAANIETEALTGGHAGFTFTAGETAHRPINADLEESDVDLQLRHVGCSDCHNPHRLTKGLHVNDGSADNNNVSGALSGISGIEATVSAGAFDPYADEDTATPVVATKEYQICYKCHSTHGHRTDNISQAGFSNTVMEFSNTSSAHPVEEGTANVGLDTDLMVAPFNTAASGITTGVGNQTMYCSDCHTNTDINGTPVSPQGSHNNDIASCDTCHAPEHYNATAGATTVASGFACQNVGDCPLADAAGNMNNLHVFHAKQATPSVCTNCHVKVPHGWKNKALLANINDADSADTRYYGTVTDAAGAKSKIDTMSPSGQWVKASCGSAGGCH